MNNNQKETATISSLTRRDAIAKGGLLATGSLLAATVAPAALLGAAAPAHAQVVNGNGRGEPGDLNILNFALGMERLEQNLYTRAAQADADRKYLKGRLGELVLILRDNETTHVNTLTTLIGQLGGTPALERAYNFPREIFIAPLAFANFAHLIEEIGIGAYLGAIGQIKSTEVRGAAASIYGVESRHAALLRHNGGFEFSPRYYEGPLTVEQVQGLIAPYIVS